MRAGDAFTIRPGCNKTFATCQAKFDNAANFRGFPHDAGACVEHGADVKWLRRIVAAYGFKQPAS